MDENCTEGMKDPVGGPLSTPEAEAAYEAMFGPVSPGGPDPEPPPSSPYELDLTSDRQAGWDSPGLAGPADREKQL